MKNIAVFFTIVLLSFNMSAQSGKFSPAFWLYSGVMKQAQRSASTLPEKKGQIQLNRKLKIELNDWFSIFAQSNVQPFGKYKINDETLIGFALERIFRYDEFKERTAAKGCDGVDEKIVKAVVVKYFDARIKQHKSVTCGAYRPEYDAKAYTRQYKHGCYIAAPSDDAWGNTGFEFAKVRRLKGIGDGYYEATVNVYLGHEGPTDVPLDVRLLSRMRAVFKYVPASIASKYLLVSYEKIR